MNEAVPARVICVHRSLYDVVSGSEPYRAELPGKFLHECRARSDLPAVGDWVEIVPRAGRASILQVLPRRTALVRRAPGGEAQVLAANVDLALIATSLNMDLSERRLDRYLALARDSGVAPVIVLTKSDLGAEPPDLAHTGAPVLVTSAVSRTGLDELRALLAPDRTAVLLGSSGTGKSSLVNALLEEERQAVLPIDEDDRGRHTTTRRELIAVPSGGFIIDTPGLRELQLLAGGVEDVDELALACRFADCAHDTEPGCAVRAAIASGTLSEERLESWRKLARELRRAAWKEKRRERALARKEKPRPAPEWE
jgi:ribosome biogenesis GTPase